MEYLWLIFALLSAITASLVAIFGKIGLTGIDSNTATAIRAVVMAIFLVSLIILEGKLSQVNTIFSNHKALFYIVLGGIAGALSWLFYFLALKAGKVSQVAPIDRLSVVFAILLAFLFLGEKLSFKAGIGAALVTVGAILIALGWSSACISLRNHSMLFDKIYKQGLIPYIVGVFTAIIFFSYLSGLKWYQIQC